MDLFCSGCHTKFKTRGSLTCHLQNNSYCMNKKRKISSLPKLCKSTDTQKACKPSETINNNQSNISTDEYCSTHDTSFDDSPLVEQSSSNDTECETNIIDENAVSNQDENMMPEIQNPNNFFEDDWYNLLPNSDLLKQQHTFSQKEFLWTQNDIVQVSLLKLLHEIQAPLYVFDQIMSWAADAQLSGYTFRTNFRHRNKLMTALYDRLDIHGLKPKKKNTKHTMEQMMRL